ncbi:hypothetical protein HAX54_018858 [Datura stramonium]|uniref:Uncharacterized protein n=1 Tax=Datura stramonium TaxID=4076 RepID=A0ABS8RJU1_DATST|nr:hypothetical protein [Datura stramonium]
MTHINGLVAAEVICSPFEYATVVTCVTQFMGAQVYVLVVLEKSFLAFEDFDNEQHMFVDDPVWVVVKIILDHILFFGTIAQFGLATICKDLATNTIPDSNIEDKILIEDGSIYMNQPKPNVYTCRDITQATIELRYWNRRPSQRLIWDPCLISNWFKRTSS